MSAAVDLTGIEWVRLSFVDVFGRSHSMQLPASRFDEAVADGAPFDGSSLEGRTRLIETDMRLRPDTSTFVDVGDGLARVVCTVLTQDGSPWLGDPRTALTALIEETGDLGAGFAVASELEFYLLDPDGLPIDAVGYFEEDEGPGIAVVREAARRLTTSGVPVDSLHHEAGPGQYEIDIAMLPALRAADALVLAKQVLRAVAGESEMRVTFMPRPLADEAGSGLHVHQRVDSFLVGEDGDLRDVGRSFLAGQLAHARGLSALAAPTVNSYKRLHSGPEAPSAALWAHVNRGALIRLSPNGPGGATLEFRGADPSANPYLLLAGLLVTGADGIESDLELPPAFEEEIGTFDPAAIDSTRSETLPRDLDEALAALVVDDALMDAFDPRLLARLVDGRRAEAAEYREQVTPWEVDRYLDEA
jgi:glutamine synthetase